MSEPAELRKARGAFFTPREISDYMAGWAIRSPRDRVLEPSCGEAAFLVSVASRLKALGARRLVEGQLEGVDIHAASLSAAAALLVDLNVEAALRVGDFFDQTPQPGFDAVVGNPPFVRYQSFVGEARAKARRAAFAQGVRLDGLASSWAAFAVHAAGFLKPAGRLALVLPAELLSVNYAGPVRRFLMRRFAEVRIIAFENRVFPGVSEEVVLLLAAGEGPTDRCQLGQARSLAGLSHLEPRSWRPPSAEGKWVAALLPGEVSDTFSELVAGDSFSPLCDWGDTELGMVTGSNRYFTLSADEARALRLSDSDLLRISPPGSRHLRRLEFGNGSWREMRASGSRAFLFRPRRDLSPAARRYIHEGENAGVQEAYKCRVRSPWWLVPLVEPPDLFLTYMNHDAPRIVSNGARVRHLNSVHGVHLRRGRRKIGQLLPVATLNSLTLLGSEIVGRAYGGGMLKLEPREADQLPVPSLSTLASSQSRLRALRPRLARHLRCGELDAAVRLVDRVLLVGRLKLRRSEVDALRSGRALMFSRREARAGRMTPTKPPDDATRAYSFRSAASRSPRSLATASTNSSIIS